MPLTGGHWSCDVRPDGPLGFRFAILEGDEVLAWVKCARDAAFITEARGLDEVALELKHLEGKGAGRQHTRKLT